MLATMCGTDGDAHDYVDTDITIVGAGAAGLSLAYRLARAPGLGNPAVALVEPPHGAGARPGDRTWCFWEHGRGPWDDTLAARWDELSVIAPGGRRSLRSLPPLSYKMLRSRDFEEGVRSALGPAVDSWTATVTSVQDGPDRAVVHALRPDGAPLRLRSRWVFDSRPLGALPPARTTLLQHFRGWFVRTERDEFDAGHALLMDLRTPQPNSGVSFGYVLPLSPREALVEYTEFTRQVIDDLEYEAALRHYTRDILGLGAFTVTSSEQGVIPMTDAHLTTRTGRRVLRIGAAGGATRPSTGYTFSGIQRQAASVVRALQRGAVPVPAVPHRRRHLAMDSVLLRALDSGRVDGAAFFAGLFERNDVRDVLNFLDGSSLLRRELAMGLTTPVVPMALTSADQALWALRGGARRHRTTTRY